MTGCEKKKIRWERDLIILTGWTQDSLKIDGVMKNGKPHESETVVCDTFLLLRCYIPGGTPLYGLYRYVWPQRVWVFSRFGHKLGIDFSHFTAILVINRVSIFPL